MEIEKTNTKYVVSIEIMWRITINSADVNTKSEESSLVEAERTGEHLFLFSSNASISRSDNHTDGRPMELWEHEHQDMVSSQLWLALDSSAEGPMGEKLNLEAERKQRPRSKTSEMQQWKAGAPQICSENSFSDGLFCFMCLLRCCFVNLNREQTMSNKQTHNLNSHHLFLTVVLSVFS